MLKEYEGYFGIKYRIVGWDGNVLITESRGKVFRLTTEDTQMLCERFQIPQKRTFSKMEVESERNILP